MNSGIYILKNKINNKIYVGQSINVFNRINEHFSKARNPTSSKDQIITKAIRKYGKEKFNIVTHFCDIENLDILEKKYIGDLNAISPNGYNLQPGGHCSKSHHEETKRKISKTKKKNKSCIGEKNPKAKLTNDDILKIKKLLLEGKTQRFIANMFNISRTTIYDIKIGRSWNDGMRLKSDKCISYGEKSPKAKLSKNNVIEIKKLLLEGKTQQFIADMFSVSKTTIQNISSGKTWKHV